ncbi:antitoxin YezG family protein [Streptococcus oralis]|nr:antitoxin YezG family protein [Streptococcus oralis]
MNLSAEFDYAPWNQSGFGSSALLKYFKYKYLGFEPQDEKELEQFKAMETFKIEQNEK